MSAVTRAVHALKREIADVCKYLSPAKDVPDAEITDTVDPALWTHISGADIKFALKETWCMYVDGWKGFAVVLGSAPEKAATPGTVETPVSLAPEMKVAGVDIPSVSAEQAREWATSTASEISSSLSDPKARQQLMQVSQQYAVLAKGLLDQFLTGYVDGKNSELKKFMESYQEQNQPPSPTSQSTSQNILNARRPEQLQ